MNASTITNKSTGRRISPSLEVADLFMLRNVLKELLASPLADNEDDWMEPSAAPFLGWKF